MTWRLNILLLLASSLPPAFAAGIVNFSGGLTLTITELQQCMPVTFTWDAGVPPYTLSSVTLEADTVKGDIGKDIQGRSFAWINDYPEGTTMSFLLQDRNGSYAVTADIVKKGPRSCTLRPAPTGSATNLGDFGGFGDLYSQVMQTLTGFGPTPPSPSMTLPASSSTAPPSLDDLPDAWSSDAGQSKVNVGAIAGGTVAGVVVLLVAIGVLVFCLRRKRKVKRNQLDAEKHEIDPVVRSGGPVMTPYPADRGSVSLSPTAAETAKQVEADRRAAVNVPLLSDVSTPELLSSKYRRFNSEPSDQTSASGASSTSPLTSVSWGQHSPPPGGLPAVTSGRPLPVPPVQQAASYSNTEESYSLELAEDAGPIAGQEVLPPRYNPEWEQRARDSETGP